MKGENRSTEESRKTDNNGQMILLAGFLVALTLISLAVVVGNSFYSQSSPDDGGISQLTSEISNQIETAKDVGLQNIVKGNENATRFEGRNETEICSSLSNVTEEGIRDQLVLSDEEVLLEVDLVGDCDDFWSGNTSYAMGQQNNSRLPGVSVNGSVKEEKTFDCEQLRGNNFTCFDKSDNKEDFNDEVVDVITNKDSGPYPDEDIIPENYSEGNGIYNYTGDKIDALENVGDIKLDELPDGVSKQEFANCIGVDVETGDSFDCDDLRSASNLDEPGVEDDFQDELLDVVQNRTDGTDVPENYSESNNSGAYNYTGHKITALENLNGTSPSDVNLSALPEEIADEPEYDSPVEGLAACVDTTIKGEKFNCTELTSDEWVGLNETKFKSELVNVVENRTGDVSNSSGVTKTYPTEDRVPASPEYNESLNDAYHYTYDKVTALQNMDSVDLDDDLPDAVEPEEFVDCLMVSLNAGESFSCSQIRNESGYEDNKGDFTEELREVVENDPDAGVSGSVPDDYNESDNDLYDYKEHKIEAINNVDDIDPEDISDGVTELDRFDNETEALAECLTIEQVGRLPVDVSFVIDTTGSMGLGYGYSDRVEDSAYPWVEPQHNGDTPTDHYRPETGVNLPDDWIEYEKLGSWDGSSDGGVGEVVMHQDDPWWCLLCNDEFAFVTGNDGGGRWEVEHIFTGNTYNNVPESRIYKARYSLGNDAPERMWYTQVGMKNALEDLTNEDRAGLVGYDTGTTEIGLGDISNSGHVLDMKEQTDQFLPRGSTDITEGLKEGRKQLPAQAGEDRTNHIVLMTDGGHSEGYPYPYDDYVEDNGDFTGDEETYIHTIALGGAADSDVLKELANDPNKAPPTGIDSDRPKGTYLEANDPEKAKDIFKEVVGNIRDESEGGFGVGGNDSSFQLDANATLGQDSLSFEGNESLNTSLNDIEFNESRDVNSTTNDDPEYDAISASGGAIEEIYEFNMNMTSFETPGNSVNEYGIGVRDVSGATEDVIWQMKVRRNYHGVETQITFESDIDSSLTRTMDNSPPDPINTSVDLSKPGRYVKMDLINEEFEVYNGTSVVADTSDYDISAARDLIDKEASGEGVTGEGIVIETIDTGPGGANGTFGLDLMPVNGNFSRISDGNLDFGGSGVDNICEPGPDDIVTCGTEDEEGGEENTAEAYASAQVKQATFEVTVETPAGGVEEREVTIDITELVE